jgi:hypothetical protein
LYLLFELNEMPGRCIVVPGNTVFVPRPVVVSEEGELLAPSLTPTPPGRWGEGGASLYAVGQYCAVKDDTLLSIALRNSTTMRTVCELNPLPGGLNCNSCDFTGSDNCCCDDPPIIREGACYNIPVATPTPSATSLVEVEESTPSLTPTLRAPTLIQPLNGTTVGMNVRLQWVSSGVLGPAEYYVVRLQNNNTGEFFSETTKNSQLQVPGEWIVPGTDYTWWVGVEAENADGLLVPVGGRSADFTFRVGS